MKIFGSGAVELETKFIITASAPQNISNQPSNKCWNCLTVFLWKCDDIINTDYPGCCAIMTHTFRNHILQGCGSTLIFCGSGSSCFSQRGSWASLTKFVKHYLIVLKMYKQIAQKSKTIELVHVYFIFKNKNITKLKFPSIFFQFFSLKIDPPS